MPIVVKYGDVGPFLGAAVGAGAADEQRKQEELAMRRAQLEMQAAQQLREDQLRLRGQDLDAYKTYMELGDRADRDMFLADREDGRFAASRETRQEELAYKAMMDAYNREQEREHRTELQSTRGDQAMERTNRRLEGQEWLQTLRDQAGMQRLDRRLEGQESLQGIRGNQAMDRVDRRLQGAGWLQDLRGAQSAERQAQGLQNQEDFYEYRLTRGQQQRVESLGDAVSMLDEQLARGDITREWHGEARRRIESQMQAIQPVRVPRSGGSGRTGGGSPSEGWTGIGDRQVPGLPDPVYEHIRLQPNARLGSAPGTWIDTDTGTTWQYNPRTSQSEIVHDRNETFQRYADIAGRQLGQNATVEAVVSRARALQDAGRESAREHGQQMQGVQFPPPRQPESPPDRDGGHPRPQSPGPRREPPRPTTSRDIPLPPRPGQGTLPQGAASPTNPLDTGYYRRRAEAANEAARIASAEPLGEADPNSSEPPPAPPPLYPTSTPGNPRVYEQSGEQGPTRRNYRMTATEIEAAIAAANPARATAERLAMDPNSSEPPPAPPPLYPTSTPGNPRVYDDSVQSEVDSLLGDTDRESQRRTIRRVEQEFRRQTDAPQIAAQAAQTIGRELQRAIDEKEREQDSLPADHTPPQHVYDRIEELRSLRAGMQRVGQMLQGRSMEQLSREEQAFVRQLQLRVRQLQLQSQMGPPVPVRVDARQQAPPSPRDGLRGDEFFRAGGVSGIGRGELGTGYR